MEEALQNLTGGNLTEVKVVLATIVMALAIYMIGLIAVGYGVVKLPFLAWGPATLAHRAVGTGVVLIALLVGFACIAAFGLESDYLLHGIAGIAVFVVLGLKIAVIRRWRSLNSWLPVLGLTVLALFAVVWATSAGDFLLGGGEE
ncbi:hypothetical protein HJD18_11545 [Thermoleophilia bacterium SCSIO 60948]|nr:hypothetical protein HJD18_11545 [Thermoleophilia bacterium SCSIO 60948]